MIEIGPYRIEHHCPQCSAPITLGENDHLLTCPYCKVRLYFSFDGFPRYYLPSEANRDEVLLVPYWRSKGIKFSIRAGGIQESVIDRTWNASGYPCFPSSLGIRPQTLGLRLIEPDDPRRLLPATLSPEEDPPEYPLPSLVGRDWPEEEDPLLFRTFLRDALSLLYLPTLPREDTIYDAIDRKAFGPVPPGLVSGEPATDGRNPCHYHFVPALCPNCGNDLNGEKESSIVFCPNCLIGFSVSNGRLQEVPFVVVNGNSTTDMFLPFWRIRVEPQGLPLPKTTGRILAGGRMQQFDRENFFFWVPAFKINPQLFLRLGHRTTIAQLQVEPLSAMPLLSSIQPVTIPLAEAVKSVKLLLALLSPKDLDLLSRLNDLSVEVKEARPALVPFEQAGCELANRQILVAVHTNALKYGRNL